MTDKELNSHDLAREIEIVKLQEENEEYCYLASKPIDRCRKDIYEEVLQKYRSIIGDDK